MAALCERDFVDEPVGAPAFGDVKQHPDTSQMQLDEWWRQPLLQAFDIGRDMDRFDIAELVQRVCVAPGSELGRCTHVDLLPVRVADVGGEELIAPKLRLLGGSF